ncbi:MAG: hypothetical protein GY942_15230 [Aestuariibacter sp.]|nr:hypothetical protein [Aestuariibacter sp.]
MLSDENNRSSNDAKNGTAVYHSKPMNLIIPVTPELSLHAGVVTTQGNRLIITPPAQTLFDQLCTWLDQCPLPTVGFNHWVLGIGATALCLRWGSYLAVLLDESKPVDPRAGQPTGSTSMISDDEMRRINIEATHNLAWLLQLWQTDEAAFFHLLRAAYSWLPMPQRRLPRHQATLDMLLRALSIHPESPMLQQLSSRVTTAVAHPHRTLANFLINSTYRNGPIENLHAGKMPAYLLTHRRCTTREAGKIVRFTAERLGAVVAALPVWHESLQEILPWPQAIGRIVAVRAYPRNWSFTEVSASIKLMRAWTV